MQRILSIILVLIILLLLSVGCTVVSGEEPNKTPQSHAEETSQESNPVSDFQYEISLDKQYVYITRYVGTSDTVVIPSKIEGISVKSLKGVIADGVISNGVFENCSVKTVIIPNSVSVIGTHTFRNCKELIKVTVPDKCEKLLNKAFENCIKLEYLDLSKTNILSVDISVFEGCVSLSEIKFPNSLSEIKSRAFYNCSALLDLTLPQNLTSIEEEAFFNCISLKTITIPSKLSLMSLESVVFYNMPSLEKIIFDDGRKTIQGYAFFDITTNAEIIIPKSVKQFSSDAFFSHGPVKFVFLGDCPEIVKKIDFYGEPIIYYNPSMSGWDTCLWKNHYSLIPLQ